MEKIADAFDKSKIEVKGDPRAFMKDVGAWIARNENNAKATINITKLPSYSGGDPNIDFTVAEMKGHRRFIVRKDGKFRANVHLCCE